MFRALISFPRLANSNFRQDHLKLCCLWYDEVLFETLGQYEETVFFNRLVGEYAKDKKAIKELSDIMVPLNRRLTIDYSLNILDLSRHAYPRWGDNDENYTYPDPQNPAEYAHNRLLHEIERQWGVDRIVDGYGVQLAEGRARIATDAVQLWLRVNSELECMLQASKDEKLAMRAFNEFTSGGNEQETPFRLFEALLPSLNEVPWHDIIAFRRNGAMLSLRQTIGQAFEDAETDLEKARNLFENLERDTVNGIVAAARPNLKKVAIESAAAIFPPIGLYFRIRNLGKAAKGKDELGWLYLMRDIEDAATSRNRHT